MGKRGQALEPWSLLVGDIYHSAAIDQPGSRELFPWVLWRCVDRIQLDRHMACIHQVMPFSCRYYEGIVG